MKSLICGKTIPIYEIGVKPLTTTLCVDSVYANVSMVFGTRRVYILELVVYTCIFSIYQRCIYMQK